MEDLFGPNSSDEESAKKSEEGTNFKEIYEIEKVKLVDIELQIRIFNFHSLNANYVWPGEFEYAIVE